MKFLHFIEAANLAQFAKVGHKIASIISCSSYTHTSKKKTNCCRKFENEVVAMTANMLHGDGYVVGSVTSGGTESILMAMKTYRDMARDLKSKITEPNVVTFDCLIHCINKKLVFQNTKQIISKEK